MKKYISCAITLLFATSMVALAAPDEATAMAKEKAAWEAFKDKKADDFRKLVSPSLIAVYATGVSDLNGELAEMQKASLKSFSISDFKVVSEDPDTMVTTYKVTTLATTGGKDKSETFYAASVWKKTGDQWKAIFHTDTSAAAEPAK